MSSFPSSKIAEVVRPDVEYQLRSVDGKCVNTVSGEDLLEIIELGLVEGRGGSLAKIQYFQLLCDSQELANAVVERAKTVRQERAKLPLDVLVGMLRSRSFSSKAFVPVMRRERGEVIASRRAVFYHVTRRCVKPNFNVIAGPAPA